MIDETMKIPEPIIEPATSIVESNKPSPLNEFLLRLTGASVTRSRHLSRLDLAEELIINRASARNAKKPRKVILREKRSV